MSGSLSAPRSWNLRQSIDDSIESAASELHRDLHMQQTDSDMLPNSMSLVRAI